MPIMMPSTLTSPARGSLDDTLDEAYRINVPHHGLLDVAGPVVSPAEPVPGVADADAPIVPPMDLAISRLMGDVGQLDHLVAKLAYRLESLLMDVPECSPNRADRAGHGFSRYVVAVDHAGERVLDVSERVALLLAILEV
jgi:hypothetical protein